MSNYMIRIFDDQRRDEAKYLYECGFSEHTLKVTDVVAGYGGCSAIIVSPSDDRTCKVCYFFLTKSCSYSSHLLLF